MPLLPSTDRHLCGLPDHVMEVGYVAHKNPSARLSGRGPHPRLILPVCRGGEA